MKYYIILILLLCCVGVLFANNASAFDVNSLKVNIANATIMESNNYDLLKVRFSVYNNGSEAADLWGNNILYLQDSKSRIYDYTDYTLSNGYYSGEDCPAFNINVNPGLSSFSLVCFEIPKEANLTYSLVLSDNHSYKNCGWCNHQSIPLQATFLPENVTAENNITTTTNSSSQSPLPSTMTKPIQPITTSNSISTNNQHPVKAVGTFGTLQIDRSLYVITNGQNITVEVDGTINNFVSGENKVTIGFTLPDGNVKNSEIIANSDGTFHTTLALDSNSDKGSYSVSATYANTPIGALTFTVKQISLSNNSNLINSQIAQTSVQPITSTTSKIPSWVKHIFIFYGQGEISDDDLIGAIQYLVQQGIIHLKS
ncbi:MAG: hypothetical protein KGI11_08445 [Thaumarchaeota archaeon]|nr:hypothetical protein [Nitrososphaerota archaeon]